MRKLVLLFITMIVFPVLSWSAPSISSVSGSITQGSTVTITGTAFTTKTSQTPFAWLNFDSVATGTRWDDLGWTNYAVWNNDGAPYDYAVVVDDPSRAWSGTKAMKGMKIKTEDFNSYFPTTQFNTLNVYITWRLYYENQPGYNVTPNGSMVLKMHRVTSSAHPYSGEPSTLVEIMPGNNDTISRHNCGTGHTNVNGTCSGTAEQYNTNTFYTKNAWHRIETWDIYSDPAGSTTGKVRVWVDRYLLFTRDDGITRSGSSPYNTRTIGQIIIPMQQSNQNSRLQWFTDDVYIDTTGPARVEICNAATWAGSTQCEIQPYTAWSNTSATITVNRGRFGATDSAYLYVVDGSNVASPAYAVTFGDTPEPPASTPASPSIRLHIYRQ